MHIHIKRPSFSASAHHDVTDFKSREKLRNKSARLKGGTWLFNEVENLVSWAWKRTFTQNRNLGTLGHSFLLQILKGVVT